MSKTLFERIIEGEIPADVVYRDDVMIAFRDIKPQAPTHLLLVPRKPIVRLSEMEEADRSVLGHILAKSKIIAELAGIKESGYRLIINNGKDAGEEVPHLHVHMLGGRRLTWPPG